MLPAWLHLPAPQIAKNYWKLADNAMMRDVLLAVRADEATHRQYVNKYFVFSGGYCFKYFLFSLESIINLLMLDPMLRIHFCFKLRKHKHRLL